MSGLERLGAELGMEARAAAEAFAANLYVLTFQENRRGGDPVAHTPEGKAVFPDKFRGGVDILPGETWLCEVTSKGGSTFFAAPLRRVDTAFLMDLTADQVERIAEVAVREHRLELGPRLEAAVAKEADEAMRTRLDVLTEENEALKARVMELEELYDDAGDRVRAYEQEARDLRTRLEDDEAASADSGGPTRPVREDRAAVRRVDPDAVASEAFVHPRYYGHISPDRSCLFLKAHGNGNLACDGGTVRIPGLARVVAFKGPRVHEAEFDPRHGGWFVRL